MFVSTIENVEPRKADECCGNLHSFSDRTCDSVKQLQVGWRSDNKMHARKLYGLLLVVLLLAVTTTSGFAQYRASLQGTVTDPTGASIPGATVTIKSTETNLTRSATTTDT